MRRLITSIGKSLIDINQQEAVIGKEYELLICKASTTTFKSI